MATLKATSPFAQETEAPDAVIQVETVEPESVALS